MAKNRLRTKQFFIDEDLDCQNFTLFNVKSLVVNDRIILGPDVSFELFCESDDIRTVIFSLKSSSDKFSFRTVEEILEIGSVVRSFKPIYAPKVYLQESILEDSQAVTKEYVDADDWATTNWNSPLLEISEMGPERQLACLTPIQEIPTTAVYVSFGETNCFKFGYNDMLYFASGSLKKWTEIDPNNGSVIEKYSWTESLVRLPGDEKMGDYLCWGPLRPSFGTEPLTPVFFNRKPTVSFVYMTKGKQAGGQSSIDEILDIIFGGDSQEIPDVEVFFGGDSNLF